MNSLERDYVTFYQKLSDHLEEYELDYIIQEVEDTFIRGIDREAATPNGEARELQRLHNL